MTKTSTSSAPILVWFRNDLRVHDNPALAWACGRGGAVIALYILEDGANGGRPLGGAARWWLHHELDALERALAERHMPLVLHRGDPLDIVPGLVETAGVSAVAWNRRYDEAGIAADKALKSMLKENGVEAVSHNGSLLVEPWTVETGGGTPYRVYTPFWRNIRERIDDLSPPSGSCGAVKATVEIDRGLDLDALDLLPKQPNWAEGWDELWTPGEDGARGALGAFLQHDLKGYGKQRDYPAVDATSRLSPHLRFGSITPLRIWSATREYASAHSGVDKDADKFLSELGWREFAYHLLYHYPDLPTENYDDKFDGFDWRDADERLERWQTGTTGYPIVDAGMRELWQTGYMHNRVRMIVASFLTKHLRMHWRHGEDWFWDTLVDADVASNALNWQWVAGSGPDAAPYFRGFNPHRQVEKFDPKRAYVERWVPEADDPAAYCEPIVEHAAARQAALDAFAALKTD